MFENKSILITGGTGSFGRKFVETIVQKYPTVKRVVIYSRDEMKQYEMAKLYPETQYPQLRFFIGDVRDLPRLQMACEGIDYIVHAAALKHVPIAEYNPMECVKTNIIGAENVIQSARSCGAKAVVALSTDKAAAPINLYGATKLVSDKLFVAANNTKGSRDLKFSVVRYGNVMASRGSVIPYFLEQKKKGSISITDERMTRFNITLDQGVDLVLHAFKNAWGGEIFVPKIPSYKIMDVADAIAPGIDFKVIGVRPGEKLHEEMITETDSLNTLEFENYFVILPTVPQWKSEDYLKRFNGKRVDYGFKYSSGTNPQFLSVEEIRGLVRTHVDPTFNPSHAGKHL